MPLLIEPAPVIPPTTSPVGVQPASLERPPRPPVLA
jgi:hypothetical protein